MNNPSKIGNIVRFHRHQSGLTQSELAQISGVGKTVIYDIEKGKKSIRVSTLFKVLDALNIRVEYESPLMSSYRELTRA